MPATIHVGDIGTNIDVTITDESGATVDVSTSTARTLTMVKPHGAVTTRAMTMPNGGEDGLCRYTTVSGDLDTVGIWTLQAHIVLPSGEWSTESKTMQVSKKL